MYIENFLTNQLMTEFRKSAAFAKVIVKQQRAYLLRHSVFPVYSSVGRCRY